MHDGRWLLRIQINSCPITRIGSNWILLLFSWHPSRQGWICDSDPPPAFVTPPWASGTGERREAERGAWSCLFVCVGSFSLLLNYLTPNWSTSVDIYISHWCRHQSYREVLLLLSVPSNFCLVLKTLFSANANGDSADRWAEDRRKHMYVPSCTTPYGEWHRDAMELSHSIARRESRKASLRQKTAYNTKATPVNFPKGSWVWHYDYSTATAKIKDGVDGVTSGQTIS